jgi:hypothetical protein
MVGNSSRAHDGNDPITHPVIVSIKGSDVDFSRSIGRRKGSPKDFARTRETREDAMLENSKRNWNRTDRRSFIGGSDARIIMGQDEKALIRLWAGKARRGRAGGPFQYADHLPGRALLATWLFVYPRLAEPHSSPATILIDKLDPGRLQCLLHLCTRFIRYSRSEPTFQTLDGREREPGSQREFGLRPSQKPTRSTELFDRDHARFPLIPFGSAAMIPFGSVWTKH